ncbi:hypothetical protein UTI89UKE3_020 [Escherichia phage vB_EcoP-UTI89UKE3]|uniref:Uncharacterized protein n=1 Tax=Escherichia phage vB_EcoP-UTI89UKE2 TaxID=2865826 RepID=A0AAE8C4F4_9CAUD|nr:hypothetical protein UTI89UKE2_020 [Escherichia phage vB_EcoP-UTI89UKE2]QZI84621.1 hypothetical protein UTI89UKE3_020 [Escherichia phage vB_EcoP-UTI89UKE3]
MENELCRLLNLELNWTLATMQSPDSILGLPMITKLVRS